VWFKKEVKPEEEDYVCRWAHTVGLVDNRHLFVFGGINDKSQAMRSVYAYDFIDNKFIPLKETTTEPLATRISNGLLSIGNGMMLLYGGEDPAGRGSFSDLWHIRVHLGEKDVHYTQAKYKGDHEHYILSWRQGFSLHFLKNMQDPVLIGGSFGNNQQSQMIMSIPESKCSNV
jgi:hypothetical protein